MPAELTRICPSCQEYRRTPDDFRDRGEERRAGRPPQVCRRCREADPQKAAAYATAKERRPQSRAAAQLRAQRHPVAIALDMYDAHPDGLKTCPPVAGCGEVLPLEAFHLSKHQRDGLNPVCISCDHDRAALRQLRND